MNDEVVKRLERSFGPDDAVLQLAEILQPFFASLDEADKTTLIAAARILAKNRRKKPAGKEDVAPSEKLVDGDEIPT